MSLSGYSNNGLNQSLSGVVTITDGISTLENGKLNCNTISVSTMSVLGAFTCGSISCNSINNSGILYTNGLSSSSTITGQTIRATSIYNTGFYYGPYVGIDNSIISIGEGGGTFFNSPYMVNIGYNTGHIYGGQNSINIGYEAGKTQTGFSSICIGSNTIANGDYSVALGHGAVSSSNNSICIGANSSSTLSNQICVGTSSETVYFNTPIISLNNNLKYLTIRECGVFLIDILPGNNNTFSELFYSITSLANRTSQTPTSGAIPNASSVTGTAAGTYSFENISNSDDKYLVYPNYGLICYDSSGYVGTIYLNYQNLTNNPVIVAPSSANSTSSVRIYYKGVEQVML